MVSTRERKKSEAEKFLKRFINNDLELSQPVYIKCSDLAKEYHEVSQISKTLKTCQAIESSFREFIRISGDKFINQYSLKDINKFIAYKKTNTSAYSARKYKIHLKAAFNYALLQGYIKTNLWKVSENVSIPQMPVLFFTKPDMNKLLSVITNPLLYDITLFALYTGMRIGEICSLETVNVSNKFILVTSSGEFTTKNKKFRIISIADDLHPVLDKWKSKNEKYLFTYLTGRKINPDTISLYFKRAVRLAKINNKYHFHCLRKTFGSWLLQGGAAISEISKLLGHSGIKVTENSYASLLNDYSNTVNIIKL